MSYLSETGTSNRKMTALGVAIIVHIAIGYALITGLATDVVKHIQQTLKTEDVKIEKPKEEPPPPPPEKLQEIPVVTPPPIVQVQTNAPPPPITTVVSTRTYVPPPTAPTHVEPPPPAPPQPPARPAAPAQSAHLRGNPQSLITADDYPDASLRAEEEGTTAIKFDVTDRGRVQNCVVAQSSGHPRLDDATCTIATRRFRYDPAKAEGGSAVAQSDVSFRFRWVIPKDR